MTWYLIQNYKQNYDSFSKNKVVLESAQSFKEKSKCREISFLYSNLQTETLIQNEKKKKEGKTRSKFSRH